VVSDITNQATSLSGFISSDGITFTAEFLPNEASLYEWHYRDLAQQYHDRYSFAILPSSQHHSVVRCRNNLNDEDFTLKELWLAGALNELVAQCTTPLILEPTRKDIAELGQMAARAGKHMVMHYFATSDTKKETYHKEMREFAKKYSNDLLLTIIDTKEYPLMPGMAGLGAGAGISLENLRTGELFPYSRQEISATKLEEFLVDIFKGAVLPWDGSQTELSHDEL
jgi:protein disulfide-isomerase A1